MTKRIILFFISINYFLAYTQNDDKLTISGNFQGIFQGYVRDSVIGASTEVYNKTKSSADAWLFLNMAYKGYKAEVRYDLFSNSPLLNPLSVYNKQGIGYWQISKDIQNLNITAGYFYDQFASGMIFRAYEDRLIGIDYAIQGIRVKYHYKNFAIKAFSGQQKGNVYRNDRFTVSPEVIKGINAEYNFNIANKVSIIAGSSFVNRTLDLATMKSVVSFIESSPPNTKFIPKYNTYATNGYATITYKNFTFYNEYVYKTREAIKDQSGDIFINRDGNIIYSSASYSKSRLGKNKKMSFGINAQYKRIENFSFRTSPFETLNNGTINYLPSITKQNTYRLLARYTAATQQLGEEAIQGDIIITPKKGLSILLNASHVRSLAENGDGNGNPIKLFHELYGEVQMKLSKISKLKIGLQNIYYDQIRYQQKDSHYLSVKALTPFLEYTHKLSRFKSIRIESQYLHTMQDLGSFLNAIIEYNFAPHWSFSIGDMVNIDPHRTVSNTMPADIIHYYNIFGSYSTGPTVITVAYLKQVQGVNCTGGICRVEPAFSGARVTLSTSF